MDALQVTEQFVAAINAHDLGAMTSSISPDHRFIDSLGNVVQGREAMREGWMVYFHMVPDYRLALQGRFLAAGQDGSEVVLTGTANGSYCADGGLRPNSAWSTPVAVRAKVRGSFVIEWQVYADNEPIREQMRTANA